MASHFSTRHAVPLTVVRFSSPRTSRGPRVECPRNGRARALNTGHGYVLDSVASMPHPRPWQSLDHVLTTATPQARPCPRSVRVHRHGAAANCPGPRNLRAQSAECPRPRTGSELTGDSDWPRPTPGIIPIMFGPRRQQHSNSRELVHGLV